MAQDEMTRTTDVYTLPKKGSLHERWQTNAMRLQDRLRDATQAGEHNAARCWAIAGGIATEKSLLLAGQPTQLVAHLHAHRHDLAGIIDKLALVGRRVSGTTLASSTSIDCATNETRGVDGQPPDVGHGHRRLSPRGRRKKGTV